MWSVEDILSQDTKPGIGTPKRPNPSRPCYKYVHHYDYFDQLTEEFQLQEAPTVLFSPISPSMSPASMTFSPVSPIMPPATVLFDVQVNYSKKDWTQVSGSP